MIQYISQPKKTMDEKGNRYLTGVNCVADVAMQSFMATKHLYGKDTGTFFYQYTQSFSPEEELTPAQAHEIGLELAERFFPGCEVLVATHVDREHLHSHLVVNSVHPDTGKKLHFTPKTLEQMRKVSDQICMEHGLSTLKPYRQEHRTRGLSAGEYRAAMRGESWKFRLITTVEAVMQRAGSREEFIQEMKRQGYHIRWEENRKHITYITPTGMKCRDDKLHELKFRKENMEHEFGIRNQAAKQRLSQNRTISVSKQYVRNPDGSLELTRPKTENSVRLVSIPQTAVDLLIQEHNKHPDNPYLFPSPITGELYHPDSVVNLHKKILKDAGLSHIRFHDLRHTFATPALQNGVDVKTVSSMLGHYDAGFTLRTYTHATRQKQDEAAATMGNFMAQVM